MEKLAPMDWSERVLWACLALLGLVLAGFMLYVTTALYVVDPLWRSENPFSVGGVAENVAWLGLMLSWTFMGLAAAFYGAGRLVRRRRRAFLFRAAAYGCSALVMTSAAVWILFLAMDAVVAGSVTFWGAVLAVTFACAFASFARSTARRAVESRRSAGQSPHPE